MVRLRAAVGETFAGSPQLAPGRVALPFTNSHGDARWPASTGTPAGSRRAARQSVQPGLFAVEGSVRETPNGQSTPPRKSADTGDRLILEFRDR